MRGERAAFCVMSKLLPIAASQDEPTTFALDYHTKQFVDPAYWQGAVEARFHFDEPGLQDREFVGRLVEFCGDYPVIVIQEVGGSGATFVKRPLSDIPLHQLQDPESVAAFWADFLSTAKHPLTPGCTLPVLPAMAMSPSLGRLHYDAKSGFGFIVSSHGYCTLVDLRDEESARESNHVLVEFSEVAALSLRARQMVDVRDGEFHARMDGLFKDPTSEVFQTLRFYKLSDDERAMEVFGCNYRAVKRTLEALTLALTMSMGPGGELGAGDRAVWHPWEGSVDKALSLHQGEGWWDDMAAPEKLGKLMERVCAAMGCEMRYVPMSESERKTAKEREGGRMVDARTIALEWASEFKVWAQSASGHEAVEAGVRLREIIGSKRIGAH